MSKILFLNFGRQQGVILDMPKFYIGEVMVGCKQAEVKVNPYCQVVSFAIVGI
jgi:hypothetical protein